MKKIVSLFVVFILGGTGMPGCYPCKCPDVATIDKYADIEGVSSFLSKKATATSGLGSVKANDRLSWDEIALFSVVYVIRTYGYDLPKKKVGTWGLAAYACDCVQPGYLGSTERLKNMTVKTVFDFDATHPAGSALDEWVQVDFYPSGKTLKRFLAEGPIPGISLGRHDLTITKAPSVKGPFALDITVELDNGEIYTTQTLIVQLQ